MLGQFLPKLNNYPMDTRKMNGNYSGQFFQLHENVLPSDTLFDRACVCDDFSDISLYIIESFMLFIKNLIMVYILFNILYIYF